MKQLPLKFVGGEIAGGQSKFRTTASNNIVNETGTEDMTNENFGSLEQQQQLEMSQEMDEEEIEDQI